MGNLASIVENYSGRSLPSLIGGYIAGYRYNDHIIREGRLGYRQRMELFYRPREESGYKPDNLVSDAAKILAGEYHINSKRVWLWEDRLREFDKLYLQLKKEKSCRKQLGQLKSIVESNTYLQRKHPEKFRQICRKLKREGVLARAGRYCKKWILKRYSKSRKRCLA